MNTNTQKEEAFKQLLKTLFAEKKRDRAPHKKWVAKEKLESDASVSQNIEIESYKNQLAKAKDALTKLVDDLKKVKEEIGILHAENKKAKALIGQLEQEKNQAEETQKEKARLEEILAVERVEKKLLKNTLKAKEQEWQEIERIKGERMQLVERLATCLSQMQKQGEIIKELQKVSKENEVKPGP